MPITGDMLIGASVVRGTQGAQRAFDPARNEHIEPEFGLGGQAEVDRACELAAAAFDDYRAAPLARRAAFLESIADNIMALGDELIARGMAESGLPEARLQGERARTVGQLRLFARVVRDGLFLDATIDPAQPERKPMPRSDLRLARVPLGPVAVFGASNFPLAFSVIVKAHSGHPGLSELVGRAIQQAVKDNDLPEGVFSLLFGAGRTLGDALVSHPAIKAVGFTGSRQGGLALVRTANARPEPIPVYAEMASINPVFLFPGALAARAESIAQGFATSLTGSVGQLCTNPGLLIAIDGPDLERFEKATKEALQNVPAGTMLTPGIADAFQSGIAQLSGVEGVSRVAQGLSAEDRPNCAQAALYSTTAERFLADTALESEVFGPASLLVRVRDVAQMRDIAEHLEGQLTSTLQIEAGDIDAARTLLPTLERKAGRILANGFPTGVEVCHAMVHGGPFPSTSNAMTTSVGATAIDRFLRPVCYQDMPDALLPEALKQENPLGLWRLVDGALQQP
jgi:alpha-ketoglutaric semialdehyde dehydrogenase